MSSTYATSMAHQKAKAPTMIFPTIMVTGEAIIDSTERHNAPRYHRAHGSGRDRGSSRGMGPARRGMGPAPASGSGILPVSRRRACVASPAAWRWSRSRSVPATPTPSAPSRPSGGHGLAFHPDRLPGHRTPAPAAPIPPLGGWGRAGHRGWGLACDLTPQMLLFPK